ncbi:TerC family protein [Derxia gummosa]|uniref:TerC family protein n=1 Tax=Derxia gummosa DSM 723 TaxID=1121388 RepID=A0A8B6X9V2_9BURK|nr:TerC family protein [Derxia gummosa]
MEAFLAASVMGHPAWQWLIFAAVVLVLLVLDLGLFNRKDHVIGVRESLKMSAFYVFISLAFGGWVWWQMGSTAAVEYTTGYLIEKSLSMDNVFVIAMLFSYFAIPREYQHRVLFWGVLGAIVMRGVMIGAGAALIERFGWIMWFFGAFLLFTGVKMWFGAEHEPDMANNKLIGWLRRHLRVTPKLHGHDFFARLPKEPGGKPVLWVTPLFLAVVVIEFVDLVFAVDSVPAIFAITLDPFLVYTSNIFAILGLRSLYFALAAMIHRFDYLKYALALVLVFVGGKILAAEFIGHIPALLSLGITLAILAGGVIVSLVKTRDQAGGEGAAEPADARLGEGAARPTPN